MSTPLGLAPCLTLFRSRVTGCPPPTRLPALFLLSPCTHAAATTSPERLAIRSRPSGQYVAGRLPDQTAGRSPNRALRGLLQIHSRCGLATRSRAQGGSTPSEYFGWRRCNLEPPRSLTNWNDSCRTPRVTAGVQPPETMHASDHIRPDLGGTEANVPFKEGVLQSVRCSGDDASNQRTIDSCRRCSPSRRAETLSGTPAGRSRVGGGWSRGLPHFSLSCKFHACDEL